MNLFVNMQLYLFMINVVFKMALNGSKETFCKNSVPSKIDVIITFE